VQGFVWNPEGKSHLEDQGIDGKMGSEWILGKCINSYTDPF
jgi:hypothetical protein